jgi:hypothetical protein
VSVEISISGNKGDNVKEITLHLPCGGKRARMIFGLSNLSLDPQEQHDQIREEAICILQTLQMEVSEQLPLRG